MRIGFCVYFTGDEIMDAVILAAGQGTRMNSNIPKVLHEIGEKSIIQHILSSLNPLGFHNKYVVIGYGGEEVMESLSGWDVSFVWQEERKGTADALLQVQDSVNSSGLFVLPGDVPLLETEHIHDFLENFKDNNHFASVLTTEVDDPSGYGRIIRDDTGEIKCIVEDTDLRSEQQDIQEINTGIYAFNNEPLLWDHLRDINKDNNQGEYYLTEIIRLLREGNFGVHAHLNRNSAQFLGVNTRSELAIAERRLNQRQISRVISDGVTICDPSSTYIGPEVSVGKDSVIRPFTYLAGDTTIGTRCTIGPFAYIRNSTCEEGIEIKYSGVENKSVTDHLVPGRNN